MSRDSARHPDEGGEHTGANARVDATAPASPGPTASVINLAAIFAAVWGAFVGVRTAVAYDASTCRAARELGCECVEPMPALCAEDALYADESDEAMRACGLRCITPPSGE